MSIGLAPRGLGGTISGTHSFNHLPSTPQFVPGKVIKVPDMALSAASFNIDTIDQVQAMITKTPEITPEREGTIWDESSTEPCDFAGTDRPFTERTAEIVQKLRAYAQRTQTMAGELCAEAAAHIEEIYKQPPPLAQKTETYWIKKAVNKSAANMHGAPMMQAVAEEAARDLAKRILASNACVMTQDKDYDGDHYTFIWKVEFAVPPNTSRAPTVQDAPPGYVPYAGQQLQNVPHPYTQQMQQIAQQQQAYQNLLHQQMYGGLSNNPLSILGAGQQAGLSGSLPGAPWPNSNVPTYAGTCAGTNAAPTTTYRTTATTNPNTINDPLIQHRKSVVDQMRQIYKKGRP